MKKLNLADKKHWTKKDREEIVKMLKLRENRINDKKISIDEEIPLNFEILTIITEKRIFKMFINVDEYYNTETFERNDKPIPTYRDLLKKIGYEEEYGTVKFLFESYLCGVVYEHGNYCSKDEMNYVWFNGSLEGFAWYEQNNDRQIP